MKAEEKELVKLRRCEGEQRADMAATILRGRDIRGVG